MRDHRVNIPHPELGSLALIYNRGLLIYHLSLAFK